jgi:sensor histidine kinase regulating citrate/malate metabolism
VGERVSERGGEGRGVEIRRLPCFQTTTNTRELSHRQALHPQPSAKHSSTMLELTKHVSEPYISGMLVSPLSQARKHNSRLRFVLECLAEVIEGGEKAGVAEVICA